MIITEQDPLSQQTLAGPPPPARPRAARCRGETPPPCRTSHPSARRRPRSRTCSGQGRRPFRPAPGTRWQSRLRWRRKR
ncbi:hypothetical protein C6N75_26255 [Streptomyces solincola]|uniref:Uncharacterized protein n=1 Tax=Streptomyces solincola TaxID=2100817 RepID=A0A2S9PPG4_9ACTN|nr:hypothetical protein C6N75_26255 [Streptomyces solincola]